MPYNRIRTFNKHVLNPLFRRVAGRPRSPFALLRHVGRRSRKTYETPLIVEPLGKDFVFALTYGPEVDWYRNVVASGRCTLLWKGKAYDLENPQVIDRETALQAFPRPARLLLRLLNRRHFMRMQQQDDASIVEITNS